MKAHEKLDRWIKKNGIKKTWLAERCGVTPSAVTMWIKGTNTPLYELRMAIQRITGGAVKVADWSADNGK